MMDYGPALTHTYEFGDDATNFAYKGVAVRLDSGGGGVAAGKYWTVFDEDTLRIAGFFTGDEFIDYSGIMFDGQHGRHPRPTGEIYFENLTGPGWANPETGSFTDLRLRGRDDRPYGPLPRGWGQFLGQYRYGDRIIFYYRIGETQVLESPALTFSDFDEPVLVRTLNIGPRSQELKLRIAHDNRVTARVKGAELEPEVVDDPETGELWQVLLIPAGDEPLQFHLFTTYADMRASAEDYISAFNGPLDLSRFTTGGPSQWPEELKLPIETQDHGAFAVDVLTHPAINPWQARVRCTGLDFYPDGDRMAVCTWDGDVWQVSGLSNLAEGIAWRRIASGLFQPLGLKIIDEQIHLTCRDQLCILHDLNGDLETDYYECFNSDPSGDRTFPRVRDGAANRRRREFLLCEKRAARLETARAASRHVTADHA